MKLNKKQKRTATIASMAALLAVVLGMGGQTFAKYTETHVAKTGQATVAEFGFVDKDGDTAYCIGDEIYVKFIKPVKISNINANIEKNEI